jgi:hypothetical protein
LIIIVGTEEGATHISSRLTEEPHIWEILLSGSVKGQGATEGMAEISWHRRETRRQTEKTNFSLSPWKSPVYSTGSPDLPELMISQFFNLLKSLISGKIKRVRIKQELFRVQSNPFCRGICAYCRNLKFSGIA